MKEDLELRLVVRTGRQVAWMICEYFKVSDTDEADLDLNEIMKVELKDDNRSINDGMKP